MKRILLSVFCASLVSIGFAQNRSIELPKGTTASSLNLNLQSLPLSKSTAVQVNQFKNGKAARNSQEVYLLDYSSVDEYNATQAGVAYHPNYVIPINERFDTSSVGQENMKLRTVGVFFDTLVVENESNPGAFDRVIPFSAATLTIDTLAIFYNYEAAPANPTTDNLTINIYTPPLSFSNNGRYDSKITSTPVFTKSYTGSDLATLVTDPDGLELLIVPVHYSLPKGMPFFVTVSYDADVTAPFNMGYGFADSCEDLTQFLLRPSTLPGNSMYYMNFMQQNPQGAAVNSSGWFDNVSLSVPTMPASCRYLDYQNWLIWAQVSADVDFGVRAESSKTIACPGEAVTLTANGYGSDDISYVWTTSRGTLSTPNDGETVLTTDSTTHVTVVATDNNSGTTSTSELTIVFRGVNININNGNPIEINCGEKGILTAALSGYTSGSKMFTWNIPATGDTTTTSVSLGGLSAGTYKVTITNSAGCTASTTASIVYPNVTNEVSFTVTPDVSPASGIQVCINQPTTFTNTSSATTGWTATWYIDNNESDYGDVVDYIFATGGRHKVYLQSEDANGCLFTSSGVDVNVLSATSSSCQNVSVGDVRFENNVSLLPNPTSGSVNLTVNDAVNTTSVKIYNVIGAEVAKYNFEGNGTISKNLNIDKFANGTYLVKVESNGKTAVKRLTVAK